MNEQCARCTKQAAVAVNCSGCSAQALASGEDPSSKKCTCFVFVNLLKYLFKGYLTCGLLSNSLVCKVLDQFEQLLSVEQNKLKS